MTGIGWAMVGLAAGYVALALYGKYRIIREEFHQAREEEAARLNPPAPTEDEPPISS